jgi:hypothetical protein
MASSLQCLLITLKKKASPSEFFISGIPGIETRIFPLIHGDLKKILKRF